MKKVFIKGISYYLPEKILSNSDLVEEFPNWTAEKVVKKIGINTRHISAEDETAGDMAVKAAQKLFSEWNIKSEEIDFILLCTQSPDYFLPTTACIIQDKLNIPINSGALDYNLGCSGYIYGLALAKGLVVAGTAKNVLLLTSETYTKHIHPQDKNNRSIFGDAAAATLVSDSGFAEIGNFAFGTDGKGAKNLIVENGAMKQRSKTCKELINKEFGADYLYMKGTEIFTFTLERVPILINETLINNNLIKDNISLYVFHQANQYMLNFLRKKIGIDENKFFFFMSDVGNTVSSTIPIALNEALKKGIAKDKILIAGFGVGYSWGGVVLNYII